jgi:hypothetical protein
MTTELDIFGQDRATAERVLRLDDEWRQHSLKLIRGVWAATVWVVGTGRSRKAWVRYPHHSALGRNGLLVAGVGNRKETIDRALAARTARDLHI